MQKIKIYQIDAFTDKLFSGNPAAVCILDKWLPDEQMQSIGNENKLTARQLSKRGGELFCELKNDRCLIGGNARLYLTGEINVK